MEQEKEKSNRIGNFSNLINFNLKCNVTPEMGATFREVGSHPKGYDLS